MMQRIDKPDNADDYTHMGNYKGPKGHYFTTGGNYNLIYESMSDSVSVRNEIGDWYQIDGKHFDVTHNYSRGGAIPNVPSAGNVAQHGGGKAAHNPTASDILNDCDMTGITVTATPEPPDYTFDVREWTEDGELWTDDEAPAIVSGPASTEALREYRFKPNLF